jgi:hypothetical protein
MDRFNTIELTIDCIVWFGDANIIHVVFYLQGEFCGGWVG